MATYTVNSTADDGSAAAQTACENGTAGCTLRAAILRAHSDAGTADTINFNLSGATPHTISPNSSGWGALPTIFGPVTIDGTTEPDYAGSPVIEINGGSSVNVDGLQINADNVTVRGLALYWFDNDGIDIVGNNNVVASNYVGLKSDGSACRGNDQYGILIDGRPSGSTNNTSHLRWRIIQRPEKRYRFQRRHRGVC